MRNAGPKPRNTKGATVRQHHQVFNGKPYTDGHLSIERARELGERVKTLLATVNRRPGLFDGSLDAAEIALVAREAASAGIWALENGAVLEARQSRFW